MICTTLDMSPRGCAIKKGIIKILYMTVVTHKNVCKYLLDIFFYKKLEFILH